jgi:hypothetical protein
MRLPNWNSLLERGTASTAPQIYSNRYTPSAAKAKPELLYPEAMFSNGFFSRNSHLQTLKKGKLTLHLL